MKIWYSSMPVWKASRWSSLPHADEWPEGDLTLFNLVSVRYPADLKRVMGDPNHEGCHP